MATPDRLAAYLAVLEADGQPVRAGAGADWGVGGRTDGGSADGQGDSEPELKSGQFHDVVLAGRVAYRFPRDEEARRLLPGRVALLTALGQREMPAAVPVPLRTSWLDRPLGRCYVPLTRLSGMPPGPGLLDDPLAANAMAAQLAELLDRLAALGTSAPVSEAVPKARADDWHDWSEQVRAVLFPLMPAAGRRRAEGELAAVERVPATGDALVHTDLGGANLLLATDASVPRLAGILDWDSACIGNQANDVASLAVTFGWPVAARIEHRRDGTGRRLGEGVGALLEQARLIAATFALQQALPAALSGDEANLADGLSQYT
jgi:aminoglycoside phosphotransferase (APT) family kinase protein